MRSRKTSMPAASTSMVAARSPVAPAWRRGGAALALRRRHLVAAFRYPYRRHATPTSAPRPGARWTPCPRRTRSIRRRRRRRWDTAWYALASGVRETRFDAGQLEQTLAAWSAGHPGHPRTRVRMIRADAARLARPPTRIALLLPFDDTLGVAASAIRDGFVLGWSSSSGPRPRLDIYSTSDRALHEVVQEAVAAGAEFLVGPLQKELVETLRDDTTLPVPALALNVVDSPGATRCSRFFQFGLTPEDEAREVARRALRQGRRALVLAPDTAWGRRLGAPTPPAWSDVDGALLSVVYFNDRLESYADAIERALNIDLSTARTAALGRHLGLAVVGAPRRRADVDLILLAAFPDDARQVMPQLRYFGAGDLPVFATSHVYAGNLDAERDRDLDGIAFGDMPWLFGAAERELHALVRETWATTATATHASTHSASTPTASCRTWRACAPNPTCACPGPASTLSMGTPGVLERQLLWMRFGRRAAGPRCGAAERRCPALSRHWAGDDAAARRALRSPGRTRPQAVDCARWPAISLAVAVSSISSCATATS